jgi:Flp pilus assembly protein TadG
LRRTIEWRKLIGLARDERGSELVEFAVTAVLLVAIVFGVIDFGMAMYAEHFVSSAAQQGARYAIVRGSDWTSTCSTSAPPNFVLSYHCNASSSDVQNYVKSLAGMGLSSTNVSAAASWPGTTPDCASACSACTTATNATGCMVQVQVTYTFTFLKLRFLPQSVLKLTSTAEQVIQE